MDMSQQYEGLEDGDWQQQEASDQQRFEEEFHHDPAYLEQLAHLKRFYSFWDSWAKGEK